MKPDFGRFCPLIKKDCIQVQCAWFVQISGTNPNTGIEVNDWGCSIAWMPVLMIENSATQRQTGAAVESFRNEMVRANTSPLALPVDGAKRLTCE